MRNLVETNQLVSEMVVAIRAVLLCTHRERAFKYMHQNSTTEDLVQLTHSAAIELGTKGECGVISVAIGILLAGESIQFTHCDNGNHIYLSVKCSDGNLMVDINTCTDTIITEHKDVFGYHTDDAIVELEWDTDDDGNELEWDATKGSLFNVIDGDDLGVFMLANFFRIYFNGRRPPFVPEKHNDVFECKTDAEVVSIIASAVIGSPQVFHYCNPEEFLKVGYYS